MSLSSKEIAKLVNFTSKRELLSFSTFMELSIILMSGLNLKNSFLRDLIRSMSIIKLLRGVREIQSHLFHFLTESAIVLDKCLER